MEMIRARDGAMVELSLTVKEGERRGGSVNARERGGDGTILMFQRISLSQSLTHYIHSSLSAQP